MPILHTLLLEIHEKYDFKGEGEIIIILARPVQIAPEPLNCPEQTVSMHSLGSIKLVLDTIPKLSPSITIYQV